MVLRIVLLVITLPSCAWRVTITSASLIVPGLQDRDCYAQPGDLYIGGLLRITKKSPPGVATMCSDVVGDVYRAQYVEAVVLAVDQINRDSWMLPNLTLGFVLADTCGLDLAALAQATHFLPNDGGRGLDGGDRKLDRTCASGPPEVPIVGVVGPASSREAVLAASVMSAFQIPIIGTTATSDELSDKIRFEYFFRMVPPDKFQVEAIFDLLVHSNWTYVSLFYSDGSYGEGAAKVVTREAKIRGICLPVTNMISADITVSDMMYHVNRLVRNKEARVVILFLQTSQLRVLFETIRQEKLQSMFIWISGDSMVNSDHGRAADGAFVMHHVLPRVSSFDNYILSLTPENNPDNPWMKRHWQQVYNCKWGLGNATDGNIPCEQYRNTPKVDIRLASYASTAMNSVYALAYSLHNLISDLCPMAFQDKSLLSNCIQGPTQLKYLRNLSFVGVGGETIRFDENGDMMGRFSIKQYVSTRKVLYSEVAFWDREKNAFDVYEENINWDVFRGAGMDSSEEESQSQATDGPPESVCSKPCKENQYVIQRELPCCWDCHHCRSNERINDNKTSCEVCEPFTWPDSVLQSHCVPIDPSYTQLSSASTISILTLTILGIISAVLVISWFIAHWNNKLVKASSRQLTAILLFGAVLAFLTIFAFLFRPDEITCILSRYGFFFSVTLIYAPLAVKTNRIYRIFSAGKKGNKKPTAISNRSQMVFTLIIILAQGAMSILSGILSPPEAHLRMPVPTERFVELFCNLPLVALLPPLSLNILLVCACAVYGFLTRKLPENFNESWYIFVSVATTLFLWLVFLPTYFTAFYASHQVTLLSSCLLINAAVTLVCLFVPKIYAIHFVDESKIKMDNSASTVGTETSSVPSE